MHHDDNAGYKTFSESHFSLQASEAPISFDNPVRPAPDGANKLL